MGRILILEPNPEVRELFVHVAARLGYDSVTEVDSGEPVDAVVVEPDAPRELEIARTVRARSPSTPVVCASTVAPTPEVRRDLEPTAYLTKPFSLQRFESALKAALAQV